MGLKAFFSTHPILGILGVLSLATSARYAWTGQSPILSIHPLPGAPPVTPAGSIGPGGNLAVSVKVGQSVSVGMSGGGGNPGYSNNPALTEVTSAGSTIVVTGVAAGTDPVMVMFGSPAGAANGTLTVTVTA